MQKKKLMLQLVVHKETNGLQMLINANHAAKVCHSDKLTL
jgi:hypothetical protein